MLGREWGVETVDWTRIDELGGYYNEDRGKGQIQETFTCKTGCEERGRD